MRAARLRPSFLCIAAVCGAVLTAADGPTLSTPSVWKPTSKLSDATEKINLTPFANQKIAFSPLVDSRKDKGFVGENREKAQAR
ncbi:hypothetical protein OY671_012854, partial [Metschnikowia pulcherrima]